MRDLIELKRGQVLSAGKLVWEKKKIQYVTRGKSGKSQQLAANCFNRDEQLSRAETTHRGYVADTFTKQGLTPANWHATSSNMTHLLFVIEVGLIQCCSPFSRSADTSLSPVTCFGWLPNPATDARTCQGSHGVFPDETVSQTSQLELNVRSNRQLTNARYLGKFCLCGSR